MNRDEIEILLNEIISENPNVDPRRDSRHRGFLIGMVMERSSGKADPKIVSQQITLAYPKPTKKLFVGPCVIESEDHCLFMASILKEIVSQHGDYFDFHFKASWDKANRTSLESYRGPGLLPGVKILKKVKEAVGCKIITDVHQTQDIGHVSTVADVIQIPAFLCRQTDLLTVAASTYRDINIKKGQWCAPWDMEHPVKKVRSSWSNESTKKANVFITERGSSFGYNRNVVDFTGLVCMQSIAPVILDCTHSVQNPGGRGGLSGGDRRLAPVIARAGAAVGVDGYFMEVHHDPDAALSDGPNSLDIPLFEKTLREIVEIEKAYDGTKVY